MGEERNPIDNLKKPQQEPSPAAVSVPATAPKDAATLPAIPAGQGKPTVSAKERLLQETSRPAPVRPTAPPPPVPQKAATASPQPNMRSAQAEANAIFGGENAFDKIRAAAGSILRPLRTFKGDIEETVGKTSASVVSIAAAEAKKRAAESLATEAAAEAPTQRHSGLRIAGYVGSAILILSGIAALATIFYSSSQEEARRDVSPRSPIFVDETVELPLSTVSRPALHVSLIRLRDETSLSLGLVRQIFLTEVATSGEKALAAAPTFLRRIADNVPATLLRDLTEPYLVGVHVFDGNQPFLLLTVRSYERAYASMLEWEPNMEADLNPFFARRPRPRTFDDATTTPETAVLPSSFRDRIYENRDTRALLNEYGDVTLLWTFIDRDTLLVATNQGTLREVVSRVRNAPLEERPENE